MHEQKDDISTCLCYTTPLRTRTQGRWFMLEQKDTLQEGRTTVLAHCPIRTSDLCITSATPYHLAKQAFDLMTDNFSKIIIS
jgi:hypothetical protein